MNKLIHHSLGLAVSLALVLSACSSPAPTAAPTEAAPATEAVVATVTTAPTEVPTTVPTEMPTATPEPTATSAPVPQVIDGSNAAGLALAKVIDLPRQPNLLVDSPYGPFLSGISAGYTPDSQHLLLRTDAGVEVLSAATLDVEKQYPGLRLVSILNEGHFVALQGQTLLKVDPLTGDMEPIQTEADLSGVFAVSPVGDQIASTVAPDLVRLYSLAGGAPVDIKLGKAHLPERLRYTGDGATLVMDLITSGDARFEAYETATGIKIYDYHTYRAPELSADGKYAVTQDFNNIVVIETATGKVTNQMAAGYSLGRGCNAGTCVDNAMHLMGFSVAGGPEAAITTWEQEMGTNPEGDAWTASDYVITSATYLQDLVTGKQKFVFDGYTLENLLGGVGAPDGSAFLLIKTDGELDTHSLTDGKRLAQTDRYSFGSLPQLSPDGSLVGWANLKGVYAYDWQNAKSVLEKPQPLITTGSNFVGFLPDGRLLSESSPKGGVGLDVWNLASGSIDTTLPNLKDCDADAVGVHILCTVPASSARRILVLDHPDTIVFSNSDPNITVLSPTADSYATCALDSGTITYKPFDGKKVAIKQSCQPMVYSADGKTLVLQNGMVLNLPSVDSTVTLEVDANGLAFNTASPAAFFGPDFIVIDNRVFDAANGKLLVTLPLANVTGYVLSEDGLTLNALTAQGIEQWQVTQ